MNKRTIYITFAAVVIIILAVLASTFIPSSKTPDITLPSPVTGDLNGTSNGDSNILVVTTETVCSSLRILSRAESFSRTYTVKTLWDGGESEESISVWQKGNNIRMSISGKNSTKNMLVLGNEFYLWYDGSSAIRKSTLGEASFYKTDRHARLISYEELLEADVEDITDAGYVDKLNEPCIFAEYRDGDNYVNRIYVSVNSGLLVASERFENGKLAVSMETVSTELSTPADSIFTVPAG